MISELVTDVRSVANTGIVVAYSNELRPTRSQLTTPHKEGTRNVLYNDGSVARGEVEYDNGTFHHPRNAK